MKKVIALVLMIVVCLSIVSCGNKADTVRGGTEVTALDEGGVKYNYSAIKTYPYDSGMSEGWPSPFEELCSYSDCLIEFVVTGEYEMITYEFIDQGAVEEAKALGYTGQDLEEAIKMSTYTSTRAKLPICVENVIFEKEGLNVQDFDHIWIMGNMVGHEESYVEGGRFVAFATVPNFEELPQDFSLADDVFFIDENECLVPFFDIKPYTDFAGTSLEDFKARALEAVNKEKLE